MTTIHIEVTPRHARASVFKPDFGSSGITQYCYVSGEIRISGTYAHQELRFEESGQALQVPNRCTIRITASPSGQVHGEITYLDGYSDIELGISESSSFHADLDLPNDDFRYLASALPAVHISQVDVVLSFRAPDTDISGYQAIWDIAKSGGPRSTSIELDAFSINFKSVEARDET